MNKSCGLEGCSRRPTWEVRNSRLSAMSLRMYSCSVHLASVVEPGIKNEIIPLEDNNYTATTGFSPPWPSLCAVAVSKAA